MRHLVLALGWALMLVGPAAPHDQWANGEPVPAWVKKACCGPEDVHHLRPEQVHQMSDGYHVDGYHAVIPYTTALPSPDGDFWIFYRNFQDGSQSNVYCFFAGVQGS